jgi:hypothetical protein
MTFLAALRCDRIDAPCVLDQPVNGQSFTEYRNPDTGLAARTGFSEAIQWVTGGIAGCGRVRAGFAP